MRRIAICLVVLAGTAHADDAIRVGAAVGAGGQGAATYSGLDLALDVQWRGARLGLGARGVWLDGELRMRDWQRAPDAVRVVRLFELAGSAGGTQLAIAGGGLAPAQLGHVADGHRAALDDRPRTGARGAVVSETFSLGLEIDDVLEPSLVGGALAWQLAPPWGVQAAAAIDPREALAAIEVAATRRWEIEHTRAELGAGVVGEPGLGLAGVAFANAALDRGGARWTASAELRAGSGTVGAAFGPLHRLERSLHEGEAGVGGALAAGVAHPAGWLRLGVRARPALGTLATIHAGAPMNRWVQAGGWLAANRRFTAGAAELRIAWARRLSSAFEVARMYDADAMAPAPAWSVTAWFAVASD